MRVGVNGVVCVLRVLLCLLACSAEVCCLPRMCPPLELRWLCPPLERSWLCPPSVAALCPPLDHFMRCMPRLDACSSGERTSVAAGWRRQGGID